MLKSLILGLLTSLAATQNPPAYLYSCGGFVKLINITATPSAPQVSAAPSSSVHAPARQHTRTRGVTLSSYPEFPLQAGDTVFINATGVSRSACTGGIGQINAFLDSVNVYQTQVNSCGLGQQIDLDGFGTATFDALACPMAANTLAKIGMVVPIPSMAFGLGVLNITLNATDSSGNSAYCIGVGISL